VRGSHELATKIERKKLSSRDENRHLDIRREVNCPMSALVERYEAEYAVKKKSYSRERSVLKGIRTAFGRRFVREIDGAAIQRWYGDLTSVKGLSAGTAVRHFNVMHHMMGRAATIWSADTGISLNPADSVEVRRVDDQRERFMSLEELQALREALDQKRYRKSERHKSGFSRDLNQTFYRLRLTVLIALTTGMRMGEIFALEWQDLDFSSGLIAVRAKLKNGKVRFVPMTVELAQEFRSYPRTLGEPRIFPPRGRSEGERQRVERSFRTILDLAGISNFRCDDLRHTFASWYMMSGGDLYELAKILGHANIKMTERYAKLAKAHISRTSSTAQRMWRLMEDGYKVG
jgi:integrase